MASTLFVSGTTLASSWLNDVNTAVYTNIPLLAPLDSPSFTAPTLGAALATSINRITFTLPNTAATITIADNKTLTVSNTVTFTGTDGSVVNYGTGGTLGTVAYSTATPTNGYVLSGNGTAWVAAVPSATPNVPTSVRTSNTILSTADKGSLIEITSGTFTQTYQAAATLLPGWYVYYKNSGLGVVTHDPNSTETIGGVTTAACNPGDVWMVICDGSNLKLIRIAGKNYSLLTSGTSYTVPAGVYRLFVKMTAGGGGGSSGNTVYAENGASGGYLEGFASVAPGQVITYAIGAGGAATVGIGTGGTGGSTTFLTFTCTGGGAANNPGTATGGAINKTGNKGSVIDDVPLGGDALLGDYGAGGAGANGGASGAGTAGAIYLEYV